MRLRHACIVFLGAVPVACELPDTARTGRTDAPRPEVVRYDPPIEINGAVERWLDYYRNEGRENFEITLARAGRYESLMRETFRRKGLPEDLVYMSLIESGFKPTAYSRAGARGLWQFVPGTARIYKLEMNRWVDERLDPIAATEAAAEYLEDLHREFGDWYLTAAAYNAGPGRVHQAMRRARSRDYWTLTRRGGLRPETRDYVPKLIAATIIARQPERFGIRTKVEPIATFDIAYVPDATSIDVVAEAAGVPVEKILALNLHLLRGITPPGRRYAVRLPAGTPRIFAENYARVPPSERVRSVLHVVRRGETIDRIARAYGIGSSEIHLANEGLDPSRLLAGQRLVIPGARNIPGIAD